jgi:uncharacterized protein YwgA/O-acetyl-ADP-ribose deacetylase (regulator of RNase III)
MKVLVGNIFNSEAQTLVNTVNCVGIMGKGIAVEFKKRFPEMYKDYIARCEKKSIKPGEPYLFSNGFFLPQIVNFPTKNHWRAASRIGDIEKGLKILSKKYKEWNIKSIAIPPLGCGNGQLLWESVGPLIYKYVSEWDIPVVIFAPYSVPLYQLKINFLLEESKLKKVSSGKRISRKIDPAWVALVEIVSRVEKQRYHTPIGRTIFQKIAYAATTLGLPTGLSYQRSSFGPYSPELNDLKKIMADAGIIQEKKLGNMFRIFPGLNYKDVYDKYSDDIKEWNNIIDKTADLFLRLNTDKAEIAATVLFVKENINKKNDLSEKDIFIEVMKWKNKRRPPLDKNDIIETIQNLVNRKWLDLKPSREITANQPDL